MRTVVDPRHPKFKKKKGWESLRQMNITAVDSYVSLLWTLNPIKQIKKAEETKRWLENVGVRS